MEVILLLLFYVSLIGIIGAAVLLGDPESDSCLGKLNYVLTVWLMTKLENILLRLPGGKRLATSLKSLGHYLCNEPNPVLQLLYLSLVMGGYVVFQLYGLHRIPNEYLGSVHLYTSHIAVLFTILSFIKASVTSPGFITNRSFPKYADNFPYDGFLYVKRDCSTCKLRKPARSKHCSICGFCVSKFDHHCPWINICVGEGNYKDFLNFLCATLVLLWYTTYVISCILLHIIDSNKLFDRVFFNRATGERFEATYFIVLNFLFHEEGLLVGLLLLASVMGCVMIGFIGYHLYLISQGTTTNESSKWSTVDRYYIALEKHRAEHHIKKRDETNLFDPDKMPALEERTESMFPWEKPANIYQHGFFKNMKQIYFPVCNRRPVVQTTTNSKDKKQQ